MCVFNSAVQILMQIRTCCGRVQYVPRISTMNTMELSINNGTVAPPNRQPWIWSICISNRETNRALTNINLTHLNLYYLFCLYRPVPSSRVSKCDHSVGLYRKYVIEKGIICTIHDAYSRSREYKSPYNVIKSLKSLNSNQCWFWSLNSGLRIKTYIVEYYTNKSRGWFRNYASQHGIMYRQIGESKCSVAGVHNEYT